MNDSDIEKGVITALENVMDPEVGKSVYELQLIRELHVEDGIVKLIFVPSSFLCPIALPLAINIRDALKAVDGVKNVDLHVYGHSMRDSINQIMENLYRSDKIAMESSEKNGEEE